MLWRRINAVRRNHALEHATVAVMLARQGSSPRLVGRAVPGGFYLYGDLPTDLIRRSAEEGLARLQRGESQLAVTPLCGTNIVVAAVLAGVLSILGMGSQRRIDRLPTVFLGAALGILAAQPLGRLVQQYLTTRPDLENVALDSVEASFGGRIHKVKTTSIA